MNKPLYHTTKIEFIESILQSGLLPKNGKNSNAINDKKSKVCFSEGIEGLIGLTMEFQRKFDEKYKYEYKSLEDFLGDSIYITFDLEDIINQGNYIDGKIDNSISPEKIRVCTLKNMKTGEVSYNRDDLVKYFMSKVPVEEYKIPDESGLKEKEKEAVLTKIKGYYLKRQKELREFDHESYSLEKIYLNIFCKEYLNKDKNNFISNLKEKVNTEISNIQEKENNIEITKLKDVEYTELYK